jgi:hypothetical protein
MKAAMALRNSPVNSVIVACCLLASIASAGAEPIPDSENGRYKFSPDGNGLVRLDTRTGAVSNCSNSSTGWACYVVPDERTAMDAEIGRLQAENQKLKAQLASRDGTEALPKSDSQSAPRTVEPKVAEGERKFQIPLPSDQDMDRMISFVERAWRQLVEMAARVQKDVAGKI